MPPTPILSAALAGSCYPADPAKLLKEFGQALKNAPAPRKKAVSAPGYIVPHIDFRVNLDIYAEVYRMIVSRNQFPEVFVILGVGHRCPHEFSLCPFVFETPLGRVDTEETLVQKIQEECPFPLKLSPSTFYHEHSLEFVIVWLQALRDLYFPGKEFKVIPLLMGGLQDWLAAGTQPDSESAFFQLGRALKKQVPAENSVLIASIDGCHVGPRFDHDFDAVPRVQKIVKKWEKELWSKCSSGKLEEFFQHAAHIQNAFYFDGIGVLSLLLQHFNLKVTLSSQDLWYEESDHSFVTFSGGWFDNSHPVGTQ